MAKPVRIFIDRQELLGYTEMRLKRSKDEMTGELTFSVFMGHLPEEPVLVEATKGREVLVYIGGHLAFSGFLDRRRDTGAKSGSSGTARHTSAKGSSRNLSIGADEYTVRFTARGKTKYIIDSSQQHQTGTMLRPTNRSAIDELVGPWDVDVQWEAEEIDLDKIRLRDGGHVAEEVQRIAEMTSLYIYETRDGRLKVEDGSVARTGEPIVLGTNILNFSTEQAEDTEKSSIKVKGQRTEVEQWGDSAVLPTENQVEDNNVQAFVPLTVQLYGNATPILLERRAQFEMNKRSAQSKRVELEVFHVQQTGMLPWDIGVIHYVEIPPAGVFDLLEVIELEYIVDNDETLKTRLVLSPAPVQLTTSTGGFLGDVPELESIAAQAAVRRSQAGVSFGASGSQIWASPALRLVTSTVGAILGGVADFLADVATGSGRPPLQLPPGYRSEDETDD